MYYCRLYYAQMSSDTNMFQGEVKQKKTVVVFRSIFVHALLGFYIRQHDQLHITKSRPIIRILLTNFNWVTSKPPGTRYSHVVV